MTTNILSGWPGIDLNVSFDRNPPDDLYRVLDDALAEMERDGTLAELRVK